MTVSFIHTADIHLGRPFSDLSELGDKTQLCNQACAKSFNKITDLAIEKKVDFVLIAGDSFDNDEHDISTKLLFRNALKRLAENNIKSYVICGNHDPAELYRKYKSYFKFEDKYDGLINITGVTTEDNFAIFSPCENVKIFSISFETEEGSNPAKLLSEQKINSSDFNIALIHCDLDKKESKYAPVSREELRKSGFDYFALGHIHIPAEIEEDSCKIVYAGSPQGRTKKEVGKHGCYYVVADGKKVNSEFIPTDVVRFLSKEIDCSNCENKLQVFEEISEFINNEKSDVELSLYEVILTGITNSYSELNESGSLMEEYLANFSAGEPKKISVYRINNQTIPYVNEEEIKQDSGVIGLIANFEDNDIEDIYSEVSEIHKSIYKKLGIDTESKEFFISALEKDKNEITENVKKELKSLCNEVYNVEKV